MAMNFKEKREVLGYMKEFEGRIRINAEIKL